MTQAIAIETLTERALRVLAEFACNPLVSHVLFPSTSRLSGPPSTFAI